LHIDNKVKISGVDFTLPAGTTTTFGPGSAQVTTTIELSNAVLNVYGQLNMSENLKFVGSPFKLFSGLYVPINRILTLEAGTTLEFGDGQTLLVDGSLYGNGTFQAPIGFSKTNSQWSGITTGASPPTISLNYCNISNAATAINVGSYTNLTVDHCNISNCNIGINIIPTAHSPIPTMQITNNTFTETPNNGLGISIDGHSDILLAGNSLTGPMYYGRIKGTGISLNASSPRMLGNTIQWFKTGFSCANGSEPILEDVEGPGNNTISNNTYAIICDMSHANLGYDYGGNSICYNSAVDVWIDGGSKVFARNDSWASNSCDPQNPPGTFLIVNGSRVQEAAAGQVRLPAARMERQLKKETR
jgi:hypothetical protein